MTRTKTGIGAHAAPPKGRLAAALRAGAALLLCALPAAAGGPGSAGVQVLKNDFSPRAAGMGGAFAAVADDAYASVYNPAGLGQLYMPEASAMYYSGFEDSSLQHLSFVLPLQFQGLAGYDKPGFGVSALFSDGGKFVYRPIGAGGTVGEYSMDAESTKVLALSYGEKVFAGEVDLEGYKANMEQYLGLSAKYVGSELLQTYSASAFAIDGGWLLRDLNSGLSMGVSLSNFGSGLKYYKEDTPLPSILRVGAAWQPPTVMSQSLLLAVDMDMYLQEQLKSLRAGLEYHFQDMFSFRLGYKGMDDNKGLALGLGVHYESFALDFGMSVAGEVYNTSQVSFSYKFAGWRTAELKKKAREFRAPPPEPEKKQPAARPGAKPAGKPAAKPKTDSDFFWIY